jgi:hypothetical protein
MAIWVNPETGFEEARTNAVRPEDFEYLPSDEPAAEPGASDNPANAAVLQAGFPPVVDMVVAMSAFSAGALWSRKKRLMSVGSAAVAATTFWGSALADMAPPKPSRYLKYLVLPVVVGWYLGRKLR